MAPTFRINFSRSLVANANPRVPWWTTCTLEGATPSSETTCWRVNSETAMMALNRHRLKHLANQNALGAKTTQGLLAHTDQLLSVVLIGNNLFNTIIPVLTTSIALHTFGRNNLVLSIATGIVAFLIIVFAEITPKIVGATFPEKIALAHLDADCRRASASRPAAERRQRRPA